MKWKSHKDWKKYIVIHKNVIPKDICEQIEYETLKLMKENDRIQRYMLTDFDPAIESQFFKDLIPMCKAIFDPYYYEYAQTFGITYGTLKYDSLSITLYCDGSGKDMHYDSEILTTDGRTGDHGPVGATCPMTARGEYDGGVLNFPNQDFSYKPDAGDLVLFPSNFLFPHEVTKVNDNRVCLFPYYYVDIPDHSCAEDNLDKMRKERFSDY
jgi:hypothetical protein